MTMAFPVDEKVKARLYAVCKLLNISLEEWFETALIASEFDVLVKFLDNPVCLEESMAYPNPHIN